MKRMIAGTALALTMAFSFSACGGGDNESAPAPVVTVTASPETPTLQPTPETPETGGFTDEQFAQLIRDNTDAFDGAADADIVAAAESVCGMWDAGATFKDVVQVVFESGVDPQDGGFLAGAGTQAYCPEYLDRIPDVGSGV